MLLKRFILIGCLPSVITGCAEFYTAKTPAPVYEGAGAGATVYRQAIPSAPAPKQAEPDNQEAETAVETRPLDTGTASVPVEIKPEPLPPEQDLLTPEQEQELSVLEHGEKPADAMPEEPTTENAPEAPAQPEPAPEAAPAPKAETPAPPPVPPAPPPFEPLQSFAPLSPGVGALVLAANKSANQGNIDAATTTIERAIRIEPRNATLFYKLALLRLKQSKPRLAEDLAKKSALLASGDKQLKKHSWLLIAKAREMQNNLEGAKEARAKADKF